MAKQKKNNFTNTSSVDTSLFNKGMIKDINASFSGKENWSHAINAANNSSDGDVGVLGNEPANLHCVDLCYTVIGTIHLYGDKWVLFSTDNNSSEIGLFDDSQCEYEIIVNDECLAFNKRYLIVGASKENFDCTWQVYWDDGLNPSRTLNIDDVPWKQILSSGPGENCLTYYDSVHLDCEKLRLAPLVDTPCVKLSKADDGGQLNNGSYQVFIAYTVNEQKIGDYIGISNVQSLFDHLGVGGALTINVSNLDKDFDFYEVVILSNNFQQNQAQRLGLYSTEQSVIHIDNIDNSLGAIPFDLLPLRNPAYEKSDQMYVVNDWLIRSGPTEQFDFNYQPQANVIRSHWVSTEFSRDYYYNGGSNPTFLRDEVYAFFIRFIYNTGERSSSYHIPGRAPSLFVLQDGSTIHELDPGPSTNKVEPNEKNFEVYNTASVSSYHQTIDEDGIVIARGNMAYWQSTERYPAKQPDIWGDLCGEPIRHHKMPVENTNDVVQLSDVTGENIRLLGVEFSNITAPVDNQGKIITNIVGYEILRGSREGNRSIIGKGIIKNMRKYDMPDGEQTDKHPTTGVNEPRQGLYPNYPYNDLHYDTYLSELETDGCDDYTTSIATFPPLGSADQSPIPGSSIPNPNAETGKDGQYEHGYKKDIFTFHSPELMFRRPYLSGNELKIYGEVWGQSEGNFIPSEDHPQQKLLRNGAALVSILYGVGYAIEKMRGKKNYVNKVTQPLNIGMRGGGTPASGCLFGPYGSGNLRIAPIQGSNYGTKTGTVPTLGWITANAVLGTLGGKVLDLFVDVLLGSAKFVGDVYSGGQISPEVEEGTNTANNELAMQKYGGFVGGGSPEYTYEGSAWKSSPSIFRYLLGAVNFMAFTAEGGQQIIDIIYNLFSYQDYAYKYNSHGFYRNFSAIRDTDRFRSKIEYNAYLNNTLQGFTKNYKINNLQRPETVGVEIREWFKDTPLHDFSRFVLGDCSAPDQTTDTITESHAHWYPDLVRKRRIATWYAAMKVSYQNQYGQIDGIKQVPMRGCVDLFPTDVELSPQDLFTSDIIYGGDNYVNRYTEKTIMPFFWHFLKDGEDGVPFNYYEYQNIPHPRYWMNSEKYRLTKIAQQIVNLSLKFDEMLPNDLFYLDRQDMDCGSYGTLGGFSKLKSKADGQSDIAAGQVTTGGDFKSSGMFGIKYGYMYTHCNGINDFYVESEINLAQRDWEDAAGRYIYDEFVNSEYEAMFHSSIITEGNYYKYDWSLSVSKFLTNIVSFGNVQPRDYDPKIAETCFTYYPKRLIYSLQAQEEAKKDFWRVFLPNNYKDFKSKVNVIKPISKSGALIFFPYLSPQLFQGLDQLETDAGIKITIGDGGLFSQPFQNIVNADISNEYASCESARSVINTPSGLFFLSQAQGKVFHYTGKLENIANQGMKWWFNKYLPSELLHVFPELEGSVDVDNPVVGLGCQSIYDPNDDITYFCKQDYKINETYKDLITYSPEIGFGYNVSQGTGTPQVPYCPIGIYNPSTGKCEYTTYSAPTEIISGASAGGTGSGWGGTEGCKVDIALVWNCCMEDGGNTEILAPVLTILSSLQPLFAAGKVRVAIVKFNDNASIPENTSGVTPAYTVVTHLTDDYLKLHTAVTTWGDRIANNSESDFNEETCGNQPFNNYAQALYLAYEQLTDPTIPGTAQNIKCVWLAMSNVDNRSATGDRIIPTSSDGVIPAVTLPIVSDYQMMTNCGTQGGAVDPQPYIWPVKSLTPPGNPTLSTAQLYATAIKNEIVASGGEMFVLTVNGADTFSDPVSFAGAPTDYKSSLALCAQCCSGSGLLNDYEDWTDAGSLTGTHPTGADNYFATLASDPNGTYHAMDKHSFANNGFDPGLAYSLNIVSVIEAAILACESAGGGTDPVPGTEPGIDYICPPGCILTSNSVGQPICECLHQSIPTYIDQIMPIPGGLKNEDYFESIAWTVSYDPKAKAWISFHDWHPELSLPSINHFLTTKTFPLDPEEPPCCPPGYTLQITHKDREKECCRTYEIQPLQFPEIITSDAIPNGTPANLTCNHNNAFGWRKPMLYKCGMIGSTFACWNSDGSGYTFPPPATQSIPAWPAAECDNPASCCPTTDGTYFMEQLNSDWWRNIPTGLVAPAVQGECSADTGMVNLLAKWSNGAPIDTWLGFKAPISVPQTKIYHILLAADNQFSFRINGTVVLASPIQGSTASRTWGLMCWQNFQVGNWGTCNTREGARVMFNNCHIYQVELTEGCHEIELLGMDWGTAGMIACAIMDISEDDLKLADFAPYLADAYKWDQWDFGQAPSITTANKAMCDTMNKNGDNYIFSSQYADQMYQDSTGWICENPDITPTFGADECLPICEKIIYNLGCPEGCEEKWVNIVGSAGEVTDRQELICVCTDCVPPSFEKGTIWRHNDRCDLFSNYYGVDYPWEVEFIETTGQVVNTVRSLEYQLECYVYKGNLANDCGDRWHDLDFNFDEAIIYNTEQVSGLLRLHHLKNDPVGSLAYPLTPATGGMDILFNKVEQKYRFNMFWDLTKDRGEFIQTGQPNVEENIWITQLNGYIKDLNNVNIDYFKPLRQRKKFRHYYNKAILRRRISGNRKMLLKLVNTKLNLSFR